MSRSSLARKSGVSTSAIKSIEDGDTIPNTATLEAILNVFGAELVVRDYGED
jgi:transcriptional regulator with XRE-family HTH domain